MHQHRYLIFFHLLAFPAFAKIFFFLIPKYSSPMFSIYSSRKTFHLFNMPAVNLTSNTWCSHQHAEFSDECLTVAAGSWFRGVRAMEWLPKCPGKVLHASHILRLEEADERGGGSGTYTSTSYIYLTPTLEARHSLHTWVWDHTGRPVHLPRPLVTPGPSDIVKMTNTSNMWDLQQGRQRLITWTTQTRGCEMWRCLAPVT